MSRGAAQSFAATEFLAACERGACEEVIAVFKCQSTLSIQCKLWTFWEVAVPESLQMPRFPPLRFVKQLVAQHPKSLPLGADTFCCVVPPWQSSVLKRKRRCHGKYWPKAVQHRYVFFCLFWTLMVFVIFTENLWHWGNLQCLCLQLLCHFATDTLQKTARMPRQAVFVSVGGNKRGHKSFHGLFFSQLCSKATFFLLINCAFICQACWSMLAMTHVLVLVLVSLSSRTTQCSLAKLKTTLSENARCLQQKGSTGGKGDNTANQHKQVRHWPPLFRNVNFGHFAVNIVVLPVVQLHLWKPRCHFPSTKP